MTWREKLVIRILLIIAKMVSEDPVVRDEIHKLQTHVEVRAPKVGELEEAA